MKQVKLGSLPDAKVFQLSKNSNVWYKVNRKSKGKVWFTSVNSERTFNKTSAQKVFVQS